MSVAMARKRRTTLYLSIGGLLLMVAAVTAISARDPGGLWIRVCQAMITAGMAMWLHPRFLLPATLVVWLGPAAARASVEDLELLRTDTLLELPCLLLLAAFSALARRSLAELEEEDVLLGATKENLLGIDTETGVYEERLLMPTLEAELARSRRFGRQCALVLAAVDERRERFDYHDDDAWERSLVATASLFRGTRNHIDRVYRYGPAGFALLLPESGARDVDGLVRRLRRVARSAEPAEGQPGGPLPVHFGATFFPVCATTKDEMIRRAEVALKLAEKNPSRLQIDGAAAPELPPPAQLRRSGTPGVVASEMELAKASGDDSRPVAPFAPPEARPRLTLVEGPAGARGSPVSAGTGWVPVQSSAVAPATPDTPENVTSPNSDSEKKDSLEPPLDDLSQLLKRMDETLGMIRTLRSDSTRK